MSVLLLHFQAWTGGECTYELSGADAWKVLGIVEPFESRRTNPVVTVTIVSEDLTDENCNDNLEKLRGRLIDSGQADLLDSIQRQGE